MSETKFYQSSEFKKLQEQWNKKLEKSGLEDVEFDSDGERRLKESSLRGFVLNHQKNKVWNESKEEYFRLVGQFLYDHKFDTKIQRMMWEMHADGAGKREIHKRLGSKASVSVAERFLVETRKKMFNLYGIK